MDTQILRAMLTKRLQLNVNDEFGLQECWNQEISILSKSMQDTIDFFLTDCSIEEFFWFGEVFEDVVKKTQSQAFVECLHKKLATITEAEYDRQSFTDNFKQLGINYVEYVRQLTDDIAYADGQL